MNEIYSKVFYRQHPNLKFDDSCDLTIKFETFEDSNKSPMIMMPEGVNAKAEKYELHIASTKSIVIKSDYIVGAIRAMDTLAQLFDYKKQYLTLHSLPISIQDEPRYGYRGFMLDVSREFYPMDVVKNIIDGLRMTKINVLHLHLTDDDSWPIEMPSYPDMHKKTSFSADQSYSVKDLQTIIDYAYKRGIKIVPEIDMPGHIRSIGDDAKFLDIITCYEKYYPHLMPDDHKIHGGPSSGVLNPAKNETYEFIKNVAKDITSIFKKSDFFHFGGDEVNKQNCWMKFDEIVDFMKSKNLSDENELFNFFNEEISKIVSNYTQKEMIHWIYEKDMNSTWRNGSVVEFWGFAENINAFKQAFPNQKHILAPDDVFYLDWGVGNRYGGSLGTGYNTWANMEVFEPTDYYDEDDDRLLGGEACMWSELCTPYNVYFKVWPRLAVMSSIFWEPSRKGKHDWETIVKDLVAFRDHIQANGIPADKISSKYCEMHPDIVFKDGDQNSNFELINNILKSMQ